MTEWSEGDLVRAHPGIGYREDSRGTGTVLRVHNRWAWVQFGGDHNAPQSWHFANLLAAQPTQGGE